MRAAQNNIVSGLGWGWKTPAGGGRRRAGWTRLAAVLLAVGLTPEVRAAPPSATDFPELAAVWRPLEAFVAGTAVGAAPDDPGAAFGAAGASPAFPAGARIVAYEEHRQFLFALGQGTSVRRLIGLQPGLLVVDDLVLPQAGQETVRWVIGFRRPPTVAGRQLQLADGDQELVCETLWPATALRPAAGGARPAAAAVVPFAVEQRAAAGGTRFLHVLGLRTKGDAHAAKAARTEKDGVFALTLTTAERVFHLTLPPPGGGDAGWIAVHDAAGSALVPPRPLAAGVLPHGPEGVRLIERWDSPYRDGRQPGWDTGIPAPELKRVVESGIVKPCRVVSLGCGSGTSEVYLASRGFEVTAIDVAPTALGLAEEKAKKAGVRVRWVLASVLALPDLDPFDFIFDRGCYHNVRYVDAAGFVAALRQLSHPGTRCLILSCNRDSPPGVREHHMRGDFSALYDFEWLRDSGVESRDGSVRRESWSLLLRRKADP